MTRINTLDPSYLTDQHLVAELREISRPLNDVLAGKKGLGPPNYVLGPGHVIFFRNRLRYIERRFRELRKEFVDRGFTGFDYTLKAPPSRDYTPTREAKRLCATRLLQRFPKSARMYGERITKDQYQQIIKEFT